MSSFPSCQVFHRTFGIKSLAPFLLPCLHAVCETCVTSTAGGVISCTTCQRDVNLTETQLQKDLVREKEIFYSTVQHHPAQILCTHEDDSNKAVCWCRTFCVRTVRCNMKASKPQRNTLFRTPVKFSQSMTRNASQTLLETFDEHVDDKIEDFEDAVKPARTELDFTCK